VAKKVVRVAVIGVGAAAQVNHIPALKKSEGVELVALCDRDEEKASRVAQRYGVPRVVESIDELLRDDELDALIIATPNYLHAPMAIAALQAGKHVLVERPLARNAAEAEKMAQAAKKADLVLMCSLAHRYRSDAQILKKFVDGKELGRVFYAKAGWLRQRSNWKPEDWRDKKRVTGGGVLLDLGVQMLDLSLWMLGHPAVESVTASAHFPPQTQVEDSLCAFLRLETGAMLTLEVTWGLLMEKDFAYCNLFGEHGAALWNPLRMHRAMHGSLVNVTPAVDSPRNVYKQAVEAQIHSFLDAVRKGSASPSSVQEALTVMHLVDAIYRSAETGREVKLG
jgi:predicted dehydrogenase